MVWIQRGLTILSSFILNSEMVGIDTAVVNAQIKIYHQQSCLNYMRMNVIGLGISLGPPRTLLYSMRPSLHHSSFPGHISNLSLACNLHYPQPQLIIT
jgi:hypothetical protein